MSDQTDRVPMLVTVTGPIPAYPAGIVDGHTHVWIDPVTGADPSAPVLIALAEIEIELDAYRNAGGKVLIDCQPGGCGRNGKQLVWLSQTSRVAIVAATGFHLRRYYAPDAAIFKATTETFACHLISELSTGLEETRDTPKPARAGFIKIACEAELRRSPTHLIEAAVFAAQQTDAALEVHTERGADAEAITRFILDRGLPPGKLILCHMDKRPDFALHKELIEVGIALEYDTFFRPKYEPEKYVWPLLNKMIESGLEEGLIIATDMADRSLWLVSEGGVGAVGLITHIIPLMEAAGFPAQTIAKLTGLNISARLARVKEQIA